MTVASVEELIALALRYRLSSLRVGDVSLEFHPSAFIATTDAPQPAAGSETGEPERMEDDPDLYLSSG